MTTLTDSFVIKQGDTRPSLRTTLRDANGNAINGSAATVRFHMRKQRSATAVIDAPATWVDQANGVVEYAWQTGDTDVAGIFDYDFQVTFSDDTIESFPNAGADQLEIEPSLISGAFDFWPTSEDLAVQMNIDFDEPQALAASTLLENLAALVRSEARQDLAPATNDTVHLRGTWERKLLLPQRPVTNVTSVAFATPSGSLPLSVAAFWWTPQGVLYRGSPLARNPFEGVDDLLSDAAYQHWGGPGAEVIVTYDHGFAALPGDLRSVILQAAQRAWADPDGVEAEVIGNYSVTYARTTDPRALFSDEQLRTIHRYRRRTSS